MPQLQKTEIKARAAQLREVGEQALARHLKTHSGSVRDVLVEQDTNGRLPDFSQVALRGFGPLEAGRPVRARIVADDGRKLIAEPA